MHTNQLEILTKDGLKLHGKCWLPDGEPRKIICLVHGHGEHIGRYESFAAYFVENDLGVYAVDMRGHGLSEGKRGHIPNYDLVMSDIEELLKVARVEHIDTPIVLYGHSLGGNYVANFIITNKIKEMEAAVISSPWLRLAVVPPAAKVKLANMMRRIWPSYSDRSGLDANGLSHDKQVVADYIADPLVHDKISANLFALATAAGAQALVKSSEINLRTLVMHGASDPITSFDASREFAEKCHATFQPWDGMLHEPHNEVDRAKVLVYVKDWILK